MNLEQILGAIPSINVARFGIGGEWLIILTGTILYLSYAATVGGANLVKKYRALKGELKISFLIVFATFLTSLIYMETTGNSNAVAAAIMGVVLGNMLDNILNPLYGIE